MALLLMFSLAGAGQTHKMTESEKQKEYLAKVRETLALDYSMPDYTVRKIDEKMMGHRLASILGTFNNMYNRPSHNGSLNVIQASQIKELNYVTIKKFKLEKVIKEGNVITVLYKTTLGSNVKNIRTATLSFAFVDGVSDDRAINDFFCSMCRYIKD